MSKTLHYNLEKMNCLEDYDTSFSEYVSTVSDANLDVIDRHMYNMELRIIELENGGGSAFNIMSFTNNINIAEMGRVVDSVVLKWETTTLPKKLILDGKALDVSLKETTITEKITNTKSFQLTASGDEGIDKVKTTSITFMNGVFYGVSAKSLDDTTLFRDLAKVLSDKRGRTFTAAANLDEYIYYCVPTRLGDCTFSVGGFFGGFNNVGVASVTNSYGHAENYNIYRSVNRGLGNTTVTVS